MALNSYDQYQFTTLSALGERIGVAHSEASYRATKFGLNEPHAYRKGLLDHFLKENRNVLVCQRTGCGKSMCYQGISTALGKDYIVLLACPLLTIMEEQVKNLHNLGIPGVLLGKCPINGRSHLIGLSIYNMCRAFRDITMKQMDMCPSQTPKEAKDMAAVDGTIKPLSCTNAADMGINFKGVDMVVSCGPPQDMDTF